MSEKTCDIKGCSNTFDQKKTGRGRITEKKRKGEKVAWLCREHQQELSSNIEWRE